jgi:TRAP-type C4-dicarboxylate transport system substrate-binding protein
VDGAHWGAAQGAKSMSLWEVAKYHMKPTLGLAMDTIIINQGAIDALEPDLKKELFHLLDLRFWKRTAEYLYKEKITLADGQANMGVEVMEFPVEVQEKFKAATSTIIDEERAKGGNGAKGADMMVAYLKELGYL